MNGLPSSRCCPTSCVAFLGQTIIVSSMASFACCVRSTLARSTGSVWSLHHLLQPLCSLAAGRCTDALAATHDAGCPDDRHVHCPRASACARASRTTIRILQAASTWLPRSSPLPKNKSLLFFRNSCFPQPIPHRCGGAYRDRHETWSGMRWTRMCLLTSGTEADGEVAWSCRPDAGDKSERS